MAADHLDEWVALQPPVIFGKPTAEQQEELGAIAAKKKEWLKQVSEKRRCERYQRRHGELPLSRAEQRQALEREFEDYRDEGRGDFHLRLEWPSLGTQNVWRQTTNPALASSGTVEGYVPVDVQHGGKAWRGLEHSRWSGADYALLDGAVPVLPPLETSPPPWNAC